jgi:hypothetical protein
MRGPDYSPRILVCIGSQSIPPSPLRCDECDECDPIRQKRHPLPRNAETNSLSGQKGTGPLTQGFPDGPVTLLCCFVARPVQRNGLPFVLDPLRLGCFRPFRCTECTTPPPWSLHPRLFPYGLSSHGRVTAQYCDSSGIFKYFLSSALYTQKTAKTNPQCRGEGKNPSCGCSGVEKRVIQAY